MKLIKVTTYTCSGDSFASLLKKSPLKKRKKCAPESRFFFLLEKTTFQKYYFMGNNSTVEIFASLLTGVYSYRK